MVLPEQYSETNADDNMQYSLHDADVVCGAWNSAILVVRNHIDAALIRVLWAGHDDQGTLITMKKRTDLVTPLHRVTGPAGAPIGPAALRSLTTPSGPLLHTGLPARRPTVLTPSTTCQCTHGTKSYAECPGPWIRWHP